MASFRRKQRRRVRSEGRTFLAIPKGKRRAAMRKYRKSH